MSVADDTPKTSGTSRPSLFDLLKPRRHDRRPRPAREVRYREPRTPPPTARDLATKERYRL